MKRRTFIISLLSSTALLATKSVPAAIPRGMSETLSEAIRRVSDDFPDALRILEKIQVNSSPNSIKTEEMISRFQNLEGIKQQIGKDYQSGNCHLIAGWLISDTEVLCIAAAGSL